MNDNQVTNEEYLKLLGSKELQVYVLQSQLTEAVRKIEELRSLLKAEKGRDEESDEG